MHIIKKYVNRKLYHTNRKQYITLEGIAKLVQQGESVQVVDNESGEEITASILAQVVLQSQGRHGSLLPTSVLAGLIQIGGDTISGLRRALFSSFGGPNLLDQEIEQRIDRLVEEGSLSQPESLRWRQLLLRSDHTTLSSDQLDLPSRNDIANLHQQVDRLSSIVEQLLQNPPQKARSKDES